MLGGGLDGAWRRDADLPFTCGRCTGQAQQTPGRRGGYRNRSPSTDAAPLWKILWPLRAGEGGDGFAGSEWGGQDDWCDGMGNPCREHAAKDSDGKTCYSHRLWKSSYSDCNGPQGRPGGDGGDGGVNGPSGGGGDGGKIEVRRCRVALKKHLLNSLAMGRVRYC